MTITHLSVELIHNEMTEGGFEEVLFGTVFQQRVVHRVRPNLKTHHTEFVGKVRITGLTENVCVNEYLLVDLDCLLVLLQLSAVRPHLQQTLVGGTKENRKMTYLTNSNK